MLVFEFGFFSLQVLWTLIISETQILVWILATNFSNLCLNKKRIRNVLIKYVDDTMWYTHLLSLPSSPTRLLICHQVPAVCTTRTRRLKWDTWKTTLNLDFLKAAFVSFLMKGEGFQRLRLSREVTNNDGLKPPVKNYSLCMSRSRKKASLC